MITDFNDNQFYFLYTNLVRNIQKDTFITLLLFLVSFMCSLNKICLAIAFSLLF